MEGRLPADEVKSLERDTMSRAEVNAAILAEAGGNLWFLRPLLSTTEAERGWAWKKAYTACRDSQPCRSAKKHLQQYFDGCSRSREDVLSAWLQCVGGVQVCSPDGKLYDARYFWIGPGDVGHTVSGWVDRCVLAEAERQHQGPAWLTTASFMQPIRSHVTIGQPKAFS